MQCLASSPPPDRGSRHDGRGRRAWRLPRVAVAALCAALSVALSAPGALGAGAGFRDWISLRDQGVVKQDFDFSCGLAALATVLGQQLGIAVTEAELLQQLGLPAERLRGGSALSAEDVALINRGVSMATLSTLARGYSLAPVAVAVSMEQLAQLRVPAIAYVEVQGEPHFTVIRGLGPTGQVQVADPSWGNRLFSAQAFARLFVTDQAAGRGRLLLLSGAARAPQGAGFGITRGLPVLQSPPAPAALPALSPVGWLPR